MRAPEEIRAWRPAVPGVVEAFHARFVDHVYPMHTHDTWTLLILDSGGIKYDLDLHEHGSLGGTVTLLPPHVPHSGSSIRPEGFRKRVLYLDESCLGEELIGRSVERPVFADGLLRDRINRLHESILAPGGEFEAESRLSLISQRLAGHLTGEPDAPSPRGIRGWPPSCANSWTRDCRRASRSSRPRGSCMPTRPTWYARSAGTSA